MVEYIFVDHSGNEEVGHGSGVTREVYSTFWTEVSCSYLIGVDERVLYVRHDLYKKEWMAIWKILAKGYNDADYFPIVLSKSFMCYCLFGDVSNEDLLASFLNYISHDERLLVEKVLSKEATDDDFLSDEFLDLLEQFKSRSKVTKHNVQDIIVEIARQELVQKPHIMAACLKSVFDDLKGKFADKDILSQLYGKLKPSTKKLISLLKAEPKDDSERDAFAYFKRFIRGLNDVNVGKLLQFITGSNMIIVSYIDVMFTKNRNDFTRRPIAHTCGPCLEIPSTYNNFCELREEFTYLLQENKWEMDII